MVGGACDGEDRKRLPRGVDREGNNVSMVFDPSCDTVELRLDLAHSW